jgi:hypothetical protein
VEAQRREVMCMYGELRTKKGREKLILWDEFMWLGIRRAWTMKNFWEGGKSLRSMGTLRGKSYMFSGESN